MSAHRASLAGGQHTHLQYRAQPFAKLALCLTTGLAHLLAPTLAVPLQAATSPSTAAALFGVQQNGALSAAGHGGGGEAPPKTPAKLVLDILSIAGLVILGGIFAGLTLGLMGLDMVNLQVLSTSGSEKEKKHALKVIKLLEKGRHWVLVVLLLGNVIVNETLPVFLSDFGGGVAAVLTSTLLIVIFGEIVPQSICARYGLAIGAWCAPLVQIAMYLMAPVAWPTAKLLDWCLGEEHGTTYRKAELKTFVSLHQQIGTENLNEDEVTIIRAVLDLNDKTVKDVMTPIEDVFTMSNDDILDEAGIAQLVQSGYSRVPIHEPGKPDAVLGMLLVKKLIQYDPEDSMPVSHFHLTPLPEASPDLTLLDCLNYFQQGRSHMILISTHPGEPTGALGVVTLEDIIEEMIGEEIVDETDVFVDVHNKIKVVRSQRPASAQGQWQPLIRGIIERRRKFGGASKTPLRSSYGTMAKSNGEAASQGTKAHFGVVQQSRAVDKVAIKRPLSPTSNASYSYPNGTSRRESRDTLAESTAPASTVGSYTTQGGDDPSQAPQQSEPFIVEPGSHNGSPRVFGRRDIPEYPGAEEAAERKVSAVAASRERTEEEDADVHGDADADADAFGDGEGERRPLLDGIRKVFGGSGR